MPNMSEKMGGINPNRIKSEMVDRKVGQGEFVAVGNNFEIASEPCLVLRRNIPEDKIVYVGEEAYKGGTPIPGFRVADLVRQEQKDMHYLSLQDLIG